MKIAKSRVVLLLIFLSIATLHAQHFSKQATLKPVLINQGESKNSCVNCGMSLKMFYKTSHIATYADGTKKQYCSIGCLSGDLKNHKATKIEVVDAHTQKIIDAKSAYYVIDSDVHGTMAKRSKLAFASKQDALTFIKDHGGKLITFDQALKAAMSSGMMMK